MRVIEIRLQTHVGTASLLYLSYFFNNHYIVLNKAKNNFSLYNDDSKIVNEIFERYGTLEVRVRHTLTTRDTQNTHK